MSVKDALEMAKKNKVEIVDFKFVDVPGLWQHFSIPATDLDADKFESGLGFDGSSIRGFQSINESDMILLPDPDTAMMDPFTEHPTMSFVCNVLDAITREPYSRDPRYVAQKAEKYLKSSGIADISYWGPEIEFFIFDSVRFDQNHHEGYYHIDSVEGFWNAGNANGPNLGNKIRYKEGYFPVPPMDQYQDLRSQMVLNLEKCGIKVEVHHHEVATGGQTEIDMRFDTLTKMADRVCWYKYCAKNTAKKWGKTATFMPKPLFQDNGSGMHTHQSLWKNGTAMDPDLNKYDVEHVCTSHSRMSDKDWQDIYHEAWLLYYTPEHMKTLLRRARATGVPIGNLAKYLLTFSTTDRLEHVHPLQGGIFRLKHPSERRPGLLRESPWLFWPRFGWETFVKHLILIGAAGRLLIWQTIITYSPAAVDYRDQALAPVSDDGDETLDLLTKTTGGRAAVAHVKKIAGLTGVRIA
jgi:hypothetical protein